MTTGDEKVVAWYTDDHLTDKSATTYDPAVADRWRAKGWPVRALIPQSAYAELAADRDLWRSMATFEGKVSASVLEDLHTTQAQLAELRVRVSVMLEKWSADSGKHPGTIESIVMKAICAELRTLAAADGATTGEMKCAKPNWYR